LGLALLNLVLEIFESGLGVARAVERSGAVEFGDDVTFADAGSARGDSGEHQVAAVTEFWRREGDGLDRLDGSRGADSPTDLAPLDLCESRRAGLNRSGRGLGLPIAGGQGKGSQ
jgi:hypothetical protein